MKQTRREFLRGAIGWGGLLLAGSLQLRAGHSAEPLRRAHRYLAARQSADGAWRSGRYAAFREGDVLTPVVLWAMQAAIPGGVGVPPAGLGVSPKPLGSQVGLDRVTVFASVPRDAEPGRRDAYPTRECFARGLEWLRRLTDACCSQPNPWSALRYPLFTASYAAQVFADRGDSDRATAWVKIVEQLRTSEALGWPAGDPMCGAWSDASAPPQYIVPVPDMLAPNISATALAAGALAVTGGASRALAALPFIERCQNFHADSHAPRQDSARDENRVAAAFAPVAPWASRRSSALPLIEFAQRQDAAATLEHRSRSIFEEEAPTEFDDGGFFFALDDPIRNKAGCAGRDATGRERFHSYGTATCDGYLALRACGLAHDHPRVRAVVEWLRRNADGTAPAGQWAAGRAEARESLDFYHSQALAAVLTDLPSTSGWTRTLRERVTSALLARQGSDGAWQGAAPDSCEDEALLASAFALRALASLV